MSAGRRVGTGVGVGNRVGTGTDVGFGLMSGDGKGGREVLSCNMEKVQIFIILKQPEFFSELKVNN